MRLNLGRPRNYLLVTGAIAVACFLSAQLAVSTLNLSRHALPVWFPSGVALAALLLCGRRTWVGIWLGMSLFNLTLGVPLVMATLAAAGNAVGAIAGEALLRRFRFCLGLDSLRDVLGFIALGVVLSPAVNATLSSFNAGRDEVYNWQSFIQHWLIIWLGDGMGILVVTPLLLVWFGSLFGAGWAEQGWGRSRLQQWWQSSTFRGKPVEAILWATSLIGVSWLVFQSSPQTNIAHYPLEYLPFPFIVWAALRLGQRGTVLGSLIVSSIAIIGAVQRGGPFLAKTDGNLWDAVLLLQTFVGIITATALVLAAAVSERQRTENLLRRSEERFRVIAETAACAVMVYQGSRLLYANPATEKITEYSCAELLATDFWDLAHPDDRALVQQRGIARQEGKPVPQRYEVKIVTKTGKERWVDLTAGVISYEGKPAGIATAYDITDRKQAEEKLILAASRERLFSEFAARIRSSINLDEILQTTVDGVRKFLKADRVFISCFARENSCGAIAESVAPGWASILDWELGDDQIDQIKALFNLDRLCVINNTHQAEQTPFLTEYYQRCQVKAGMGIALMLNEEIFGVLIANQCSAPREWQPFEVELLEQLATPIEIAIQQGQLHRQVKNLAANLERQVDDRTAELQQRMQELQQTNQAKDLLLHAVSHDLRTPVQGMLMVLNRLRSKCCEDETASISRFMLDCMLQSSNDQLQLLNALRDDNMVDATTFHLNCRSYYLTEIVQEALVSLWHPLAQNQVMFLNHLAADLPAVQVDPILMRQVLESLLSNAIKHNLPGITVTIAGAVIDSPFPTPPLLPSTASPFRFLHVAIADTGQGVTQNQCDRLFQPYVRSLDNPHRTGIGLGLHRCRQIITAHGGQIGVISAPNQGTTVWFTLPLA